MFSETWGFFIGQPSPCGKACFRHKRPPCGPRLRLPRAGPRSEEPAHTLRRAPIRSVRRRGASYQTGRPPGSGHRMGYGHAQGYPPRARVLPPRASRSIPRNRPPAASRKNPRIPAITRSKPGMTKCLRHRASSTLRRKPAPFANREDDPVQWQTGMHPYPVRDRSGADADMH